MKKYNLYKKENGGENLIGLFDTVKKASEYVKDATKDEGNVFDYFTKEVEIKEVEIEVRDITKRVKSYADACEVLGVQPMNEAKMKAEGFRRDEIARRKLETIVEALNEGWKPDWNDKSQDRYTILFWIDPDKYGKGNAGIAYANTYEAHSGTITGFGSRLCFRMPTLARYAGKTFTSLYEEILVTNW